MRILKFFVLALALGPIAPTQAKLLHIIHTNDLHSMFQGTRNELGGYARLKTVVDALRAESKAKGIPSLYLDGGDFGEGSSFYFSNKGVDSLKALDMLGVDVTVLGNHDYILGGFELRNQIRAAKLKAKILSANVFGKRFIGLRKAMPSYFDYDLDGLKVRIFGLTTSEIHYQYPFRPLGWISNSHNAGIRMAEKADKDGVDYLIALTHVGLTSDIKLVESSLTIDLVVGGHSHTFIPRPKMTKNLTGREVPILQAGAHSMHVGSLLIDVQPDGKSTIIEYKAYDITKEISEEASMKEFVEAAVVSREKYFNRQWDEVIGFADIPLTGYFNGHQTSNRSCWSQHMARLTRQAGKADIGIHFDEFQGEKIAPGPITYGDIIDNFPHFRKWDRGGWKIKKAWIQGFILKRILRAANKNGMASSINVDGMESILPDGSRTHYEIVKHPVNSIFINGRRISNLKYYSVAMPSEVPHAVIKIFNIFGLLIFNNLWTVRNTDYWSLIEAYIKANSPIRCIEPNQN